MERRKSVHLIRFASVMDTKRFIPARNRLRNQPKRNRAAAGCKASGFFKILVTTDGIFDARGNQGAWTGKTFRRSPGG